MEKKFQSHAVTLPLIGQCPMSNSSELFSYTTICASLNWIEPLFFLVIVYTDKHSFAENVSFESYNKIFCRIMCMIGQITEGESKVK